MDWLDTLTVAEVVMIIFNVASVLSFLNVLCGGNQLNAIVGIVFLVMSFAISRLKKLKR